MIGPRTARTLAAALAVLLAAAGSAAAQPQAQPTSPQPPLPQVWPTPQHIEARGGDVRIESHVVEVVGPHTDPSALQTVEATLRAAGAQHITRSEGDQHVPAGELRVYVGGPTENPATAHALTRLHAGSPTGLVAGGYVLAVGRGTGHDAGHDVIALSGVDATGTYYAAQTLRQLVVPLPGHRSGVPDTVVRDWPSSPLRGVIEGFYGTPWSTADRLAQFDFLGRTKQNTYVYSPKDDPYLRAQWRDPYPPAQLAVLKTLVTRAEADHVTFTYALSPGLSICYSSDTDEQALVAKFQSLYAIGVRSFAIPLDDISYTSWNCQADQQKFGTGGAAAGAAQSFLLNRVQQDFVATHPDVARLQMVPTEYSDLSDSPYKTALRTQLAPAVIVEWTGAGVIAPTISTDQAKAARTVFGHDILLWDNYPVNDYVAARLLLGPYTGRQPGITGQLAGVTVNPMPQSTASQIAEFTSGDFLWNSGAYDPTASWQAALRALGGAAAEPWLRLFAENNYSSLIDPVESPTLTPLLAALWQAYDRHQDLTAPAARVTAYFRQLSETPNALRHAMAGSELLTEISPWLDKLGRYGDAGQTALQLLLAQAKGDQGEVTTLRATLQNDRTQLTAIPQQLAPGVLDPFLYQVLLDTEPPLGAQVAFQPTSASLRTGAARSITVQFTAPESGAATTVTWHATAQDGVTVQPSSGSLPIAAKGQASVTLTVTAAAGTTDGVRTVVVTGTDASGEAVVPRALPVQVSAATTGSTRALVANYSEPTVTPVDLGTGKALAGIGVGQNPGEIVLSPDGRHAYTANQGSNTVSVIDVAAGTVTATIPVGNTPSGEAVTPDGSTLWVANYGDGTVQPIDLATDKAGPTVKVGSGPENMAVSPDGKNLYVANINDNTVTPVDLTTGTAGAAIPAGSAPMNVVVSPDSRTVYVSDSGAPTVTPIDVATGKALPSLEIAGQDDAYGLALSPDGRTLWVQAGDDVATLDTATGREGTPIHLGNGPSSLGFDWNGATAYVTCSNNDTLVPIAVGSGAVGTAIPTGAYPLAVAVTGVPVG